MRNIPALIIGLILISASNCASKSEKPSRGDDKAQEIFTMVFYNVENLFDIYDDPRTNDNEYLPTSGKQWNQERFDTKIEHLAMVLSGLEEEAEDDADIIGLVEIENANVMEILSSANGLSDSPFQVVHANSSDDRGIDVGLLYNQNSFKYVGHEYLKVRFEDPEIKTRDILYAYGKVNGELLHVFVNHWPSRRDGADVTEYKRLNAANVLRQKIDIIMEKDSEANIVIMGDFNDYPDNKSIVEVISADSKKSKGHFYNTAAQIHEQGLRGSYNYRGNWVMLDQILISNYLMYHNRNFRLQEPDIEIFQKEWMMYRHPKYNDLRPSRTYGGDKYFGGYSDHLPVYVQFICN